MVLTLVMSHSIFYSGHHQQKRITDAFIDWFVHQYIGRRYKLDFHIITKGLIKENLYGEMGVLDDLSRPRLFEITIRYNLSKWDYLVTLAHEMIHCKQRVYKEYVTRYNRNYWYKSFVPDSVPYLDEPWEVEARKWEYYLAHESIRQGIITTVTPE